MNLAFVTGPLAQAIGWTLLHSLWQGGLVAAVLALALTITAHRSANLRYALSCAALALIVGLAVATAVRSYPSEIAPAAPPAASILAATAGHATAWVAVVAVQPDRLLAVSRTAREALPLIVSVWLAGVALFSVRLLLEWLRAQRLLTRRASPARDAWQSAARRLGHALGVRRAVRLLESAAVEVPSVIGILRPAILLPASTLTGLTAAQLDMILAHELAHVRRHDFVVNLLQAVVETLLFYHPAVWWISRRVRIERENCCDDLAVAVCGNPVQYARALTRLEELRATTPSVALSARGGSLFERIHRLVGGAPGAAGPAVRAVAGLAVLAGVVLAMAAPSLSAIGEWEPVMKRRPHDSPRAVAVVAPEPPTPALAPETETETETETDTGSHSDSDSENLSDPESSTDDDSDIDSESDDERPARERGRLSLDELIELHVHGVTPAGIRAMRSVFPGIALQDVARLSAVGATPEFVRAMRAAGLEVRTAEDAQGLAAVGVSAEVVRALRASGLAVETAEQAQGLVAVGVTAEFVRDMRSLGLTLESTEELQGLAAVGVTAEFVRGMRAAGIDVRSAQEAESLAALGVTPDYVRSMRDAGVALHESSEAQSLMALGVTPQFVKRLASAGYRNLSVTELNRLGAAGVTDGFIREMSRYRSR